MDQAKHKADFGTWLRRAWNAVMRAAEAVDRSPMEDVFDRFDRLEREMAALKALPHRMVDDTSIFDVTHGRSVEEKSLEKSRALGSSFVLLRNLI